MVKISCNKVHFETSVALFLLKKSENSNMTSRFSGFAFFISLKSLVSINRGRNIKNF